MKKRSRFLLPLVLLMMVLMAGAACAAPRLSTRAISLYKYEEPRFVDDGYSMTKKSVFYDSYGEEIAVTGVSKKAKVSTYSKKFMVEGGYDRSKGKYTFVVNPKWTDTSQVKVKPGKYPLTVKIKDRGKTYSYKITAIVRNYLPRCISYLKVGNKIYRSAFRKRNAGYITMILPKGKKKISFACPSGFVKVSGENSFEIIRSGDIIGCYKMGDKVTLKKGDILGLHYSNNPLAIQYNVFYVFYIKVK